MDESAFEYLKSSALALVSNKLETQREVNRLEHEVNAAAEQIERAVDGLQSMYDNSTQACYVWERTSNERESVLDHALLLLVKANTEQELSRAAGGRPFVRDDHTFSTMTTPEIEALCKARQHIYCCWPVFMVDLIGLFTR